MSNDQNHEPTRRPRVEGRDVVTLTPAAADSIRGTMLGLETIPPYLRISIRQDTESTFLYAMNLEMEIGADDLLGTSQRVSILIDRKSAPYLQGTVIDFQIAPKSGFLFNNPNAAPNVRTTFDEPDEDGETE